MKKSIEVQVKSGQKVVLTGTIAAIGGDDRVRIVRTRKQGQVVELLRDGQATTLGGLVIKASVPKEGPATLQVGDLRRVRRK
jgi:hypothetical protein